MTPVTTWGLQLPPWLACKLWPDVCRISSQRRGPSSLTIVPLMPIISLRRTRERVPGPPDRISKKSCEACNCAHFVKQSDQRISAGPLPSTAGLNLDPTAEEQCAQGESTNKQHLSWLGASRLLLLLVWHRTWYLGRLHTHLPM